MQTLVLPRTTLTAIMTDAQDRGAGNHGSLIGPAIDISRDNSGPWQLRTEMQADAALVYVVMEGSEADESQLADMPNAAYKMQVLLGTKGVLQLHAWRCEGETVERIHLKI